MVTHLKNKISKNKKIIKFFIIHYNKISSIIIDIYTVNSGILNQ
jgi:hypothetical protein